MIRFLLGAILGAFTGWSFAQLSDAEVERRTRPPEPYATIDGVRIGTFRGYGNEPLGIG